MSQKIVFELLKRLGGRATAKEIAELAKQIYPDSSLYTYVGKQLSSLKKWGYIRKNLDGTWSVQSEYPAD